MKTLLVRLKPHDPRRGCVLRRYTYRGIKFDGQRGRYRVDKDVADYLREVRQVAGDAHSQLAFDVCTADEAKALDAREKEEAVARSAAGDDIKVSAARGEGTVTSDDLPKSKSKGAGRKKSGG